MAFYPIGKSISEFRNRNHISQEEFCEGICSVPNLSRIESGKQNPSKKVLEALLSRAGIPIGINNVMVSEDELRRSEIESQITYSLMNADFNCKNLLDQYWNKQDKIDILSKQYYYWAEGTYYFLHEKKYDLGLQLFFDSIKLTYPKFEIDNLPENKLFTLQELKIINSLAISYHILENKKVTDQLFKYLISYYQNNKIDETIYASQYPLVLFNYINSFNSKDYGEETISLCNKGIDCNVAYRKLTLTAEFLLIKGFSYCNLNNKEEGKKYIQQSFTLFEIQKQKNYIEKYTKIANKRYNLGLTYEK